MPTNLSHATDRVDTPVPAKESRNHVTSDVQESTHIGAVPTEKASESATSVRSRRSSTTRRVAIALDFHNDGTCKLHETYTPPDQPRGSPPFACPIKPNTLRVISFDTLDVLEHRSQTVIPPHPDLPDNASCQEEAQLTTCGRCNKVKSPELSTQAMSRLQDFHQQAPNSASDIIGSTAHGRPPEIVPKPAPGSISQVDSSEPDCWNDHHRSCRGAHGINSLDLFALWDRKSPAISLPLGSNVMSQGETLTEMDQVQARTALLNYNYYMMHSLNLRGRMYAFYTIPSSLTYSWQSQALQVEFRWLRLDRHLRVRAPLAKHFWNKLCSGDSAINLFSGDLDLGARLLTFDLLSAAITSWIEFLTVVRRRSSWESRLVDLDAIAPMIGDREHLMDFSRASRDFVRAREVTIKAIELTSNFCQERKLKFDMLLLRQEVAHRLLDDLTNDIQQNADNTTTKYESLTNESQAASLRRLTLVASVFLPLSLACGLLSMTQRVTEVGAIWWDWTGIVVIIALAVIIPYKLYSSWYESRRSTTVIWVLKLVGDQWATAEQKVLEDGAKRPWPLRSKSLVPWVTRYSYEACKYMFLLAATASFLVGMFVSVVTGAQALGYSVAGTVGFLVVAVGSFRFVQLAGYVLRRKKDDDDQGHERKANKGNKQGKGKEDGTQQPKMDSKERLATGSLLCICCKGTLFVLMITPLLLAAVLFTCVLGFFFGWDALAVARQAGKNLQEQYLDFKGDTWTMTELYKNKRRAGLERPNRGDESTHRVDDENDSEDGIGSVSGSLDSEAGEDAVEGRRRRRTWTRSFDFRGPHFFSNAPTFTVRVLYFAVSSLGLMGSRRRV